MLLMFDSFGACEVRLFRLVLSSPGALTVNSRLSIRDLSSSGRQPMHSPDGGVHIVVNG